MCNQKGFTFAEVLVVAAIVTVAALVGLAAKVISNKSDTAVEEAAEELIEKETGIEIDLSPDSPE